jgi:alkylation response protein AidB-like acyl-CoA dehydrogenase
MTDAVLRTAAELAEHVLLPAAMEVELTGQIPASHLDLLAAHGLYGVSGPPEFGGLGADPGPSPLDDQLVTARANLDTGSAQTMPAARAAAAELAVRAAAALVVAAGSRSVLTDSHAQRLAREAVFLLVFGSRPAIKENLSRLFLDGGAGARRR